MTQRKYDIPPLDFLRGFEAAARTSSFTKAAEELFVTQSAVSRQIKALEDHLGVRLFERRPRALVLTADGQVLLRAVTGALDLLQDATDTLRTDARQAHLTVTTTVGFASLWLIPRLARFTNRNPSVDVRISATSDMLNLDRSRVDLAIRYCAPADAPPNSQQLFTDAMLPVCSPELAARTDKPLKSLADLAQHVLLYYEFGGLRASHMDWETWLTARGYPQLKPAAALHFNHYDQLIQAAVRGQGVALGQQRLISDLLHSGALTVPFAADSFGNRAYFLVGAEASARKPHIQAFREWLLAEARSEDVASFAGTG